MAVAHSGCCFFLRRVYILLRIILTYFSGSFQRLCYSGYSQLTPPDATQRDGRVASRRTV